WAARDLRRRHYTSKTERSTNLNPDASWATSGRGLSPTLRLAPPTAVKSLSNQLSSNLFMISPMTSPEGAGLRSRSSLQLSTRRLQSFSAEVRTPRCIFRPATDWFHRRTVYIRDGFDDDTRVPASAPRGGLRYMMDWDDVRYFLAVARGGSVRAAAEGLGVNHSTVLRRIAQLEERLGARMFERLPSGYRLTAAGEEVLEFADQMEASSQRLETRVFGRDQSVRGLLRVTLAPPLATRLLMPDFADFARLHPDIEMEISPSGELANLTNREADVAIRVVYDRKTLPLNLHGQKGPELFGGVY